MSELLLVKIRLYHLLLIKPIETLTEREVNLMYELALDKDVQQYLDSVLPQSPAPAQ